MAEFTNSPWSSPESDLDANDFCTVCLIDYNDPGGPKIKAKCKLPVRSRPGAPYNVNAIRNAMSRIFQMTDVPAEERKKAARRLVRLAREAKIEVASEALRRLAGVGE